MIRRKSDAVVDCRRLGLTFVVACILFTMIGYCLSLFTKKDVVLPTVAVDPDYTPLGLIEVDKSGLLPPLEVVISRFNESWTTIDTFLEVLALRGKVVQVVIYNKGSPRKMAAKRVVPLPFPVEIIPLPNVGRESHTYLYHLRQIRQQESMSNYVLFIPASWTDLKRMYGITRLLQSSASFAAIYGKAYNLYNFRLHEWLGENVNNRAKTIHQTFTEAPVHPFGKWFETNFNKTLPITENNMTEHSLFGTFLVAPERIYQYSVIDYSNWLCELNREGENGELGHYWERAWYLIFGLR